MLDSFIYKKGSSIHFDSAIKEHNITDKISVTLNHRNTLNKRHVMSQQTLNLQPTLHRNFIAGPQILSLTSTLPELYFRRNMDNDILRRRVDIPTTLW